ncbi:MAG TPA: right-handed parallel beta-helix repeat-containing protein [Thermoanaerobaculia bacterium]
MTAVSLLLLLLFSASNALADADLGVSGERTRINAFAFTVVNVGPEAAHDVVLFIDVPSALHVFPEGEFPQCDASVRPIRCFTPSLAKDLVQLDFAFSVVGPSPVVDATYTITARVESGSVDPDLSDNTSVLHYETVVAVDFYEQVEPAVARVDPGATQIFRTELDNFLDSDPRDIRIRYTATNALIESIRPQDSRWTCTVSGAEGECVASSMDNNCRCSGAIEVTVRASSNRAGGEAKLTMKATSTLPDRFDDLGGEATLQTYRLFAVTTTADAGPGSLRDAIVQANASCSPAPCKIAFELPPPVPADGWFTLTPATELPPMVADRIALDGTWQTRFTGDTNQRGPEVFIDGHLAWRGLVMRAGCEAIVQGLALGHFGGGDALFFSSANCFSPEADRRLVSGNYIGVDPTGTRAYPNQRGLNIEGTGEVRENVISRNKWSAIWHWRGSAFITKNLIENNGKSGIVLGPETEHASVIENVINRQTEMGVAIAPGAQLYRIWRNSMSDNGGLGIDIDIDGVSPASDNDEFPEESNAPTLLSATYDAARDVTVLKLVLHSRPLGPYFNGFILDVYANRGPDGDGEQHIFSTGLRETLDIPGNFTGKWLNATSTRTHTWAARPPDDKGSNDVRTQGFPGVGSWTSELSNTVLVTAN